MERLTRIACGWCGHATEPSRCGYCGRDPALPYLHRGETPQILNDPEAGRPVLNERQIGHRLAAAVAELGPGATVERLADFLGVSPRTVRRWKKAIDGH